MNKQSFNNLQDFYSLSKTLRFELKPVNETLKYIKEEGFLDRDEKKENEYRIIKKIIDDFHKQFIEECLKDFKLSCLAEYLDAFKSKDENKLEDIRTKMRKEISACFKMSDTFAYFKKDRSKLFSKGILKDFAKSKGYSENEINNIDIFNSFTTYFTNYCDVRLNLYADNGIRSSIAYRIVDENLKLYCENLMQIINSLQEYKKLVVNNTKLDGLLDNFHDICNFNCVLTQSGIDNYNAFVGNDGESQGLNELINLRNQNLNAGEAKLPLLHKLNKQILSDAEKRGFVLDKINNDQEMAKNIVTSYETINSSMSKNKIVDLFKNISVETSDDIYVDYRRLSDFSNDIFGSWSYIKDQYYKTYLKTKSDPKRDKFENDFKKQKAFSIKEIHEIVLEHTQDINEKNEIAGKIIHKINGITCDGISIIERIERCYKKAFDILSNATDDKKIVKDDYKILAIKEFLDSLKELELFIKTFSIDTVNVKKFNNDFYYCTGEFLRDIEVLNTVYNKTRNYLTQKPYSIEKFKINFDKPTLLSGWDINKTSTNLGVLFRKDNKYFLGIINPKNSNLFNTACLSDSDYFEKMEYKLIPSANKMIPHMYIPSENAGPKKVAELGISQEILDGYRKGLHKKGEHFDKTFLSKLIAYYIEKLNKNEDYKIFNFKFKDPQEYSDIAEFNKDVDRQSYHLGFINISSQWVYDQVAKGTLYLFEIYNKDFSEYSKGTKNLHTLYWQAVFSKENSIKNKYQLNGGAEIFYRKSSLSIDEVKRHLANEPTINKNPNNPKKHSVFDYTIYKDKRFTDDKFFFHIPITLNANSAGMSNINSFVNKVLKDNEDINVLGIDRGENNLLYICVIDRDGKILEQVSLNSIITSYVGKDKKELTINTDYQNILNKRELDNIEARKNWSTIQSLDNAKSGFLSFAVHEIVKLAIKYNCIIVLEDLNQGFKNSRVKFEKQVYSKFEKQLIDKLNYLVFKNIDQNEIGGIYHAYQLSNKFESFKKLGRQSGILFYVPAQNTSKIDPITGFIVHWKPRYNSVADSKATISKIDDIRYNEKEGYFEFDIDYKKLSSSDYKHKSKWTICSYGERIEFCLRNNQPHYNVVHLTKELENLFEMNGISINHNIKDQLLKISSKEFYEKFFRIIRLMMQLRNHDKNHEDWILSPVKGKNGHFFDTRNIKDNSMPKDPDANGAYNIARKGLLYLKDIDNAENGKPKLNASMEKYLQYIQYE